MNFIDKLLGRNVKSSSMAKERLQLVLLQDRVKLPPGTIEQMKDEIISVISKYVDIDASGIDLSLTEVSRQNCLVANIPIVRSKETVQ